MRILLIGGTGTIGSAVRDTLESRGHEVLVAHRSSSTLPVEMTDPASVDALFTTVGTVDAVAVTAGHAAYGPVSELTYDDFLSSLKGKALGQIEIVRRGASSVAPHGSFTLITGVLTKEPVLTSAAASAANGAVEAFVKAAALELAPIRVNAVSPTLIAESAPTAGYLFPGDDGVPAAEVAKAYVRSIERLETGRVYDVLS
jgi:NAD(P)-dependent dehydrogenase (short-subunit alcohol dehydrogenase family)